MDAPDELLTIERVAVLQRVALFGDVPGHTLVAVARLLEEVSFEPATASSSAARSRTGCSSSPTGRIRVHIGDMTLLEHGPGWRRRRVRAARARAPIGVGDRDRAEPAPAPPPRAVRGAARRPARDRARASSRPWRACCRPRPTTTPRRPRRDRSRPRARVARAGRSSCWPGRGSRSASPSAWILIPASAIFLEAYGSELLPVTYIGAALAGVVSSTLLAAAFRRRPLASVATTTLAGLAVALLASWLVLATTDAELGLVRAARARPDRSCRSASSSWSVRPACSSTSACSRRSTRGSSPASRSASWSAASPGRSSSRCSAPPRACSPRPRPRRRCSWCSSRRPGAATRRSSRSRRARGGRQRERPTLRALTRNRYVMLIVAFQMLSAVESQWLDFHVLATRRGALRQQQRAGPVPQPVLGDRLRDRHPVPRSSWPAGCSTASGSATG